MNLTSGLASVAAGLAIGATIVGATAGQVFFADSNGALAQSSGLVWDNVNSRFGINAIASLSAYFTVGGVQSGNAALEVAPAGGVVMSSINRTGSVYTSLSFDGSSFNVRVNGSANNGIYVPGTGATGFGTQGSPIYMGDFKGSGAYGYMRMISSDINAAGFLFAANNGSGSHGFSLYDASGSATRFSINASGHVGIGTTSQPNRLTVSGGGIQVTGLPDVTAGNGAGLYTGYSGSYVISYAINPGTAYLNYISLASKFLFSDANAVPQSKVHIVGPGSDTDALQIETGTGTSGIRFTFGNALNSYPARICSFQDASAGYLSFQPNSSATASTEVFRMYGNGDVTAGSLLNDFALGAFSMQYANRSLVGDTYTASVLSTTSQVADAGGSLGFGGFYVGTSTVGIFGSIAGRKDNSSSGDYGGYLSFATRANGTGAPVESFRITSSQIIKYSKNTTGAGSAALGANSPAVTNTAPYTWFTFLSSDGSTVYVPAWK